MILEENYQGLEQLYGTQKQKNKMKKCLKLELLLLLVISLYSSVVVFAQTNYYVSQQTGSDNNNGQSPSSPYKTVDEALNSIQSGDTLWFMGEFTNASYNPNYSYDNNINDPHIWHQENTIRINNLNGAPGQYISLKAYDHNTVLKGDGANILRITNSSYLRIEGFEIYGEVDNIPLSTALALQFLYREEDSTNSQYRVPPGTPASQVENMTFPVLNNVSRPSYTDTRGIYMSSNIHHIDLLNNYIHHTPGNGFRVQGCDYINIIGNEVHDTSRKSYSGTHGMVVTNATSVDNYTGYKIFIQRNKVHHNYNEIYSWAPSKTFITPRIDEGKGISLQRNDIANGWSHGRFLVSDNLTYWNGFSGLHSNTGVRIDFINNTAYMNSYTNTVTYANEEQSGNNIGISTQGGNDNKIINNIIFIDNAWDAFPISIANNETNIQIENNIVFGMNGTTNLDNDVTAISVNTLVTDPLFEDPSNFNFGLTNNSPAIGFANTAFATDNDFYGEERDNNPDAGAIEFSNLSVKKISSASFDVYPNPVRDVLFIKSEEVLKRVKVYDITGKEISVTIDFVQKQIDLSELATGVYLVMLNDQPIRVVKK